MEASEFPQYEHSRKFVCLISSSLRSNGVIAARIRESTNLLTFDQLCLSGLCPTAVAIFRTNVFAVKPTRLFLWEGGARQGASVSIVPRLLPLGGVAARQMPVIASRQRAYRLLLPICLHRASITLFYHGR
jgi:hypothetical protein